MADPTGTDVLTVLRGGDRESLDKLVPLLYDELKEIAHHHLDRHRRPDARDGTLATTALVNEAYLRLVDQSRAVWQDRAHFLAVSAVAMRHILVDRARARASQKRGGDFREETFETADSGDRSFDRLLEIDDALDRLALVAPRLARVVECRFYGGLSEDEIAEALGITVRTVQRDWVKAKSLLRRSLVG